MKLIYYYVNYNDIKNIINRIVDLLISLNICSLSTICIISLNYNIWIIQEFDERLWQNNTVDMVIFVRFKFSRITNSRISQKLLL